MTNPPFGDLLRARARQAELALESPEIDQLQRYLALLTTWNRAINLTALPLEPPTEQTVDRLFIEPLAAAQFLRGLRERIPNPESRIPVWFDLGSGGGSPAIPMKIALPSLDLTMVESRSRKSTFLQEVIRTLDLDRTRVERVRFEVLSADSSSVDCITCRALRTSPILQDFARRLLRPGGWLLLFSSSRTLEPFEGFTTIETVELPGSHDSFLHVLARMFHGEQYS